MAKRFFRRFSSGGDAIKRSRYLRWLAPYLAAPVLWHLNRRTVSRAMAIGLFWALIPMPWQMVPAAVAAICVRANVALSVSLVWVSNPLTWGPIWYGTYRLGRWILRQPAAESEYAGWRAMSEQMASIWQPLYLGSFVAAVVIALTAAVTVNVLWRAGLMARWNYRRRLRRAPAAL